MADWITELPRLGAGLGFRPALAAAIAERPEALDVVEITIDNFMDADGPGRIARLRERFTLVPHGLELSIARADGPDRDYLRRAKTLVDACGSPYHSDHLALTSIAGLDLGHLSPVWLGEEGLRAVIHNVRIVQDTLEKPLVLENISSPVIIPGASFSEPEFFSILTAETGCGILLDLANLHINATNHGFDALAWLDGLPLDKVVQVHLAGGVWDDAHLIDTHSGPVSDETWALFELVARRTPIRTAIIERDDDFPRFDDLLAEVAQARSIMSDTPLMWTDASAGRCNASLASK